MSDKKNIDRLFQEKFKNFEVTPDAAVWDNIHNALHKDKPKKRRVIPLWWFATGAAAILVLLLTVGNVFNNEENLNAIENQVVDTEVTQSSSEFKKGTVVDENNAVSGAIENGKVDSNATANTEASEKNGNPINNVLKKTEDRQDETASQIPSEISDRKDTNTSHTQNAVKGALNNKTIISSSKDDVIVKNNATLGQPEASKEVIDQVNKADKEHTQIAEVKNSNIINNKKSLKENKDLIASKPEGDREDNSIEEAIAKAILTNEEEKEEQSNRWNITPNVAPVYFNSLGKGSTIHSQFVNNGKSGTVNMSYGISGSYAVNDKIRVRAGINKVDLGYSTNGVIAFKDVHSFNVNSNNAELSNITFNRQSGDNSYMSTSGILSESAPQFVVTNTKNSLEQQFGYIEVPLEVEYSIINSKFGLNVIGGFSTLFLNNNEIYSISQNERSLLGESNNMNDTSYSANFGLGLNYNVSHTLKLNLEPMFKYQINTFTNTSGDFRPYFIGVYTGVSFKF